MNSLETVSLISNHLNDKSSASTGKLEEFFNSFAHELDTTVGVINFQKDDGGQITWISPGVHPGPFASLGGSDLPSKIHNHINQKDVRPVVFHSTCNHDMNPTDVNGVNRIATAVSEAIKKSGKNAQASAVVELLTPDGMKASAQLIGDMLFVTCSAGDSPTDDIDHFVGATIESRIRSLGFDKVTVVDAHNWAKKGTGYVRYGTKHANGLIDTAVHAASLVKKEKMGTLLMGHACTTREFDPAGDAVGVMGIDATVLEVMGKKYAYIVIDGNNIKPGLRDMIVKSVKGVVDWADVYTTDNHSVNATFGGFNPVGNKMDSEEITSLCTDLVTHAVSRISTVRISTSVVGVESLRVFGYDNAVRMTAVLNSTRSVMAHSAAISIAGSIVACVLVFLVL